MSSPSDRFEQETDAVSDVRRADLGQYIHEYTGVLTDTNERVRILALAPELTEVDAAVNAFVQMADQWDTASANATVLTIRDRGTDSRPWIAVPAHNGNTLATLQPELSPEAVDTIISETADALRTLGLYNTVHGSLSPDDIYLRNGADEIEDLLVEVGGFGLGATIQAAVGEFEPTAYTAPELVENPGQPTEQADVYGIGAITYFALTGSSPVEGAELEQAIQDGSSVPPSTYDEAIPAEVDDVVMQALSTRPDDRYGSPYAFGRAFLSTFDPDEFESDTTGEDETPTETTHHNSDDTTTADSSTETDSSADSTDADASSDDEDTRTIVGPDHNTGGGISRRTVLTGTLGLATVGGGGLAYSYYQDRIGHLVRSLTQRGPIWAFQSKQGGDSSPAVVDDTVYVGSDDDHVYALSIEDGTEQWAFQTGGGVPSSPAVVDDTVYVGCRDGSVYALSAADGTQQWAFETGDSVLSSPAVVDGTVYVGSEDSNVYALSAEDGTEQWAFQTGKRVTSSPAVVGGTVYVGSWDENVYALSAGNGTEQWAFQTSSWVASSPVVVGGTVYVGSYDMNVYALSAADGTQQWSYQTGRGVASSPAVVNGTVYVGSHDGWIYAIPTDGTTTDSWPMYQANRRNSGSPAGSETPTAAVTTTNISVTPTDPTVGEEVTFSGTASTTKEGATIERYEWGHRF